MQSSELNSTYTLQRLCERLRDQDNFNYQDACIAAEIVEMYCDLRATLESEKREYLLILNDRDRLAARVNELLRQVADLAKAGAL